MIFNSNKNEQWDEYKGMLEKICALSNLFSDSKVPYLYYRVHENMFSKAFNAENLSREDCAFDAKFEDIGIGLKTFVNLIDFSVLSYSFKLSISIKSIFSSKTNKLFSSLAIQW